MTEREARRVVSSVAKYSEIAWVAKRTLSKVKSRAISPRQPEVPNLIITVSRGEWMVSRSWSACHTSRITGPASRFPIERPFFQGVNVTYEEDGEEGKHRSHDQPGSFLEHLFVNDSPGIKENHFDIEQDEEHRH